MNPSASGWIRKHLTYLLTHLKEYPLDEEEMYEKLRQNGFIYGTSVNTLCDEESEQLKWTEEEKTKINLFDALTHTFYDNISNATEQQCIKAIIEFYELLDKDQKKGRFQILKESPFERLEKLIDHRIQTNEPLLKKNFSHLITNALLYIDVLAFEHYLLTNDSPEAYAKRFESIVIQTVWIALSRKQEKDTYNELLMKLFESSIRYNNWPIENQSDLMALIKGIDQPLEKKYLMDVCALAVGNDQDVDSSEMLFVKEVSLHLNLTNEETTKALQAIIGFIDRHQEDISYLQYSNPIQHFYNQTSKTVSTLILRNKSRFIKEISQSRELAILLSNSTVRELSKEEKKVVRKQLLDICKTVPSLAIFLLPGGSILMPLLVRFIPQLLPSAFNENKIE
jgi:hypothetical protein